MMTPNERADRDAAELAEYFDLERHLDDAMTLGIYADRDDAFIDWFVDRQMIEEQRCHYTDDDARKLASAEATLLKWGLDEEQVKLTLPVIALPHEMRLVKLFRLWHCRQRVRNAAELLEPTR